MPDLSIPHRYADCEYDDRQACLKDEGTRAQAECEWGLVRTNPRCGDGEKARPQWYRQRNPRNVVGGVIAP